MITTSNPTLYGVYRETSDESVGAALGVVMILMFFVFAFVYALPGEKSGPDPLNKNTAAAVSVVSQPTAALDSGDTSMN